MEAGRPRSAREKTPRVSDPNPSMHPGSRRSARSGVERWETPVASSPVVRPARPARLARLVLFGLFAVLAAAAAGRPAAAQTRADSAAVLYDAATDFDGRGDAAVAGALYRHIMARFPGTAAAEKARAALDALTARRARGGGETELIVWSTTFGIWLGIAVPAAFEAQDPEPYGVGLLAGAPAGFLSGRALTRRRPFSLGQARAVTWAGTWGTIQGLGWAMALDWGGDRAIDDYVPEESQAARFGAMIAGGLLGAGGGLLAARREISPGVSTAATMGTVWGWWIGLASSTLADLSEDQTWGTTMMTGNAGLAAGALLGSRVPLSRSRTRMISVAGLIGGVAGGGIALISQPSDKGAMGIMLAGSLTGLAVGAILTDDRGEEDPSQDGDGASEDADAALFDPSGSLLVRSARSGGRWRLSAPLPSPSWEHVGKGRARTAPAWTIPLVNVRF